MRAATDRVSAVRAFNRFYTAVIGLLGEGLLDSPYSLTEVRVLFELAQRPATEVTDLRAALGLDPGYLSRIISGFEGAGVVTKERSPSDGRRQVVRLTDRGRAEFDVLDDRSSAEIEALLGRLGEDDQRRLVGAMATVRRLLEARPAPVSFLLRPPVPGDYGWVVHRHGAVYSEQYGWDERFEALVARLVADYLESHDDRREAAWIAEVDGERAGCVFCTRVDDAVARLRLLLVEPRARAAGIGTRLVEECIKFARRAGYERMTLWTNDVLVEARRIYERAGFVLVGEHPHALFGSGLVGQDWELDLRAT